MKIGRIIVGKRKWHTSDFKIFYSPMPKKEKQLAGLHAFWWFGHGTYVVIRKKSASGRPVLPYEIYSRNSGYGRGEE